MQTYQKHLETFETFRTHGQMTVTQYSKLMNESIRTSRNQITAAEERGFLVKVPTITPFIVYRATTKEEQEQFNASQNDN